MKSYDTPAKMTVGMDYSKSDKPEVTGTFEGFDLSTMQSSLSPEAGIAFQSRLRGRGWVYSESQIQFRNTVLIDLRRSEMEMLEQMKQKTRYNIRLAEKKGVHVRAGTLADLPALYRMYAATSVRDGFVIRNETYYRTVWQAFMEAGPVGTSPWAEPLIAEVEGNDVRVYTYGQDLYNAMLAAIDDARETIFLETFIWKGDPLGQTVKISVQGRTGVNFRVVGVLESKGGTGFGVRTLVEFVRAFGA